VGQPGQRYSSRRFEEIMRSGKIIDTEARTLAEARPALEEAERIGGAVRFKKGLDIKRTDPAILEDLMDRVKAKQTRAISLRLPVSDIEAAKAIAEKMGIGY
jgi:hypothetical protein